MSNTRLAQARKNKKDEFYTRYETIHQEMNAYLDHNPDVFRGKTILCPTDDPEHSQFTAFFRDHFANYGIHRLISTSYSPNGHGKCQIVDKTGIRTFLLHGDGDFRSSEVTHFRDQSDMVITNPPFSLFREFIEWVMDGNVEFSLIGTVLVFGYKNIFPLFRDKRLWAGASKFNREILFNVPDDYVCDAHGYARIGNSAWVTNIPYVQTRKLCTTQTDLIDPIWYDNYPAIEIPRIDMIPATYDGVMGVPISYVGYHDPHMFNIVGIRTGLDGKDLQYTRGGKTKSVFSRVLIQRTS